MKRIFLFGNISHYLLQIVWCLFHYELTLKKLFRSKTPFLSFCPF